GGAAGATVDTRRFVSEHRASPPHTCGNPGSGESLGTSSGGRQSLAPAAGTRPGASRWSGSGSGSVSPESGGRGLLGLDEDALAGALLGGLDRGLEHVLGDVGQALGTARLAEDLVAFLHVGEAVVEQRE